MISGPITSSPSRRPSRSRRRSARPRAAPSSRSPFADHVPAPPVDRAVEERRRTGRGDQVEAQPQVDRVDQVAVVQQDRRLAQAPGGLVQTRTVTSAPACAAAVGRSGWNGKCAPQASSTSSGMPYRWQPSSAIPLTSAPVPYSVGVIISPPPHRADVRFTAQSLLDGTATQAGWAISRSGGPTGARARSVATGEDQRGHHRLVDVAVHQHLPARARRTPNIAVWMEMLERQVVNPSPDRRQRRRRTGARPPERPPWR